LSIDVAGFESKFELVNNKKQEKHLDLIGFPEDDFVIKTTPKIHRTNVLQQKDSTSEAVEPFVQSIFTSFGSNWSHVQYNYTKYQRATDGEEVFQFASPGYEEPLSVQQVQQRSNSSSNKQCKVQRNNRKFTILQCWRLIEMTFTSSLCPRTQAKPIKATQRKG